jgi:aminomethyltransferase
VSLLRTPLYEAHRAAGARLVEFAGWEMPVQYEGILAEHAMVRERAGLFDVSHMGQVEVRGAEALARLQWITANDVSRLADGRAQYNLLMLPTGGIVDDVIIYRHSAERFLVCVNASNRDGDVAHMREHRGAAEVVDRSDEFALLALQGPLAVELMSELAAADVTAVPPFAFVETEVAGAPCLLARTGYTGEDGWEVYCPAERAVAIWNAVLERGAARGVGPVGLGARDTLRLEAALPLYGHELDRETSPFEARLGWVVRLDKGEFIAADALRRQKQEGPRRKLVGIDVGKGAVPRQDYPVLRGDRRVGVLTSGTRSPTLGKGIALGYVEPQSSPVGTQLAVEIRGRAVPGRVVPLPFYRRSAS